jgi:hypothetical protein
MTTNSVPRIGVLSCLLSRDPETKLYLAHCLNFDLMECANTSDQAWQNLKSVVKQFIEYSSANNPESLSVSASAEEWKYFADILRHSTKPPIVDTIEIEMRPPLLESSAPIWMQGVSGDGTECSRIQ